MYYKKNNESRAFQRVEASHRNDVQNQSCEYRGSEDTQEQYRLRMQSLLLLMPPRYIDGLPQKVTHPFWIAFINRESYPII